MTENDDAGPTTTQVTMLMADAAQVATGKLYILGGGISILPARPTPVSLAMLLRVPWDQANVKHRWTVELLDEDHNPVMSGDRPIVVTGEFEAGRPPGLAPGTQLDIPLALSFGPLPVAAGGRYVFRLSIDGDHEPEWRVGFSVRDAEPAPQ